MPLILQRYPGQSYLRLGHSPALFFRLFGHDGAPSLPQSLKNIARRLTALRLTFIVEPALRTQDTWKNGSTIMVMHIVEPFCVLFSVG